MQQRGVWLAGLSFTLCLAASAAVAKGQLQAGPTLLELPSGNAAGRLTLGNTGDAPVSAQIRVYTWSQVGGEDRLTPTEEIVLSPPIAEIAPGVEQIVRFIRQGPAPSNRDNSYRVIVEELPSSKGSASTVNIRMRYVMPLFVRASDAAAPAVNCRLSTTILTCENTGGRAAQMGQTSLIDANGNSVELSAGLFGYVLAGSQRQWSLDSAKLSGLSAAVRMESQLNGQPTTVAVVRSP